MSKPYLHPSESLSGGCLQCCIHLGPAGWVPCSVRQQSVAVFITEMWEAYAFFLTCLRRVETNTSCIQRVNDVVNWEFLPRCIPQNEQNWERLYQCKILPIAPPSPFLYGRWEAKGKDFLYWGKQEGNAVFCFWSSSSCLIFLVLLSLFQLIPSHLIQMSKHVLMNTVVGRGLSPRH